MKLKQIMSEKQKKMISEANSLKFPNKIFKYSPEVCYIYGVILGDGTLGKDYFSLGSIDKEFAEKFRNEVKKWCNKVSKIYWYTDEYVISYWSINLANFLKILKIRDILKLSSNYKIQFLKGLFDSDGSMSKCGRVDFDNCNKEIIDIVSQLLEELKITHSVRISIKKGTKTNFGVYKKDLYQIHIFKESLSSFAKHINFIMSRKNPFILYDGFVKSRHSGENRSPDKLEPFDITGFSDKSESSTGWSLSRT